MTPSTSPLLPFPTLPVELQISIFSRVAAEDPKSFFTKALHLNSQIRHFCYDNRKSILAQLSADFDADEYSEFISNRCPNIPQYLDKESDLMNFVGVQGYRFFADWSLFFSVDSILIACQSGETDLFLNGFQQLSEAQVKELQNTMAYFTPADSLEIWKVILKAGYSFPTPESKLDLINKIGLIDSNKSTDVCNFFMENGFKFGIAEVKAVVEAAPHGDHIHFDAANYTARCHCGKPCCEETPISRVINFSDKKLWTGFTYYYIDRMKKAGRSDEAIFDGIASLYNFLFVKSVQFESEDLFDICVDRHPFAIFPNRTLAKGVREALFIASDEFMDLIIEVFDCFDLVQRTIHHLYDSREQWSVSMVNTILNSNANEQHFMKSLFRKAVGRKDLVTCMLILISGAGIAPGAEGRAEYLREMREMASRIKFDEMVVLISSMLNL